MGFFSKLKAKWKLDCFISNYDEGVISNFVADCLINENWVYFKEKDSFIAVVKTNSGKVIEFWQENKYYAFFCRGSMTLNDSHISWNNEMPSVEKILAIVEKMKKVKMELLVEAFKADQ